MPPARPVQNHSISLPGSPDMHLFNNDKQIRNATLLFSMLLHAALFVQFNNMAMSSQAQAPKIETRISLNLLPPPKPKPVTPTEQRPVKPKPLAKKRVLKKKQQIIQPEYQQAVAPKLAKQVQREQPGKVVPARQRYLTRLLTHIEGYKYYPRTARLRGIEGSIRISFRLHDNGEISGLIASGGPLVLRRAATGAVNKALPLPVCPPEVSCPMQVSYAMQFQLR